MGEYLQFTFEKFIFKVKKRYYYHSNDCWAKIENHEALVGISDYLQKSSGDAAFFEIKEVGTSVKQGEELGNLETFKTVINLISPVTGVIKKVNEKLQEKPELINEDPYDSAWMAVIETSDWEKDKENLLDADKYFELMKKKIEEEGSKEN